MAVTIDKQISQYFTWGSYPYSTWGGSVEKTWETSGLVETILTDAERIVMDEGYAWQVVFDDFNISFNETEDVFAATTIPKDVKKVVKDSIKLADGFNRKTVSFKDLAEAIKVSETYWDVIQFKLHFAENFAFKEGKKWKNIDKVSKNSLAIAENYTRSFAKGIKEQTNINEVLAREFVAQREFTENVKLKELNINDYSSYQQDVFAIDDYANRGIGKVHIQPLNVTDDFTRKATYKSYYDEGVALSDSNVNTTLKLFNEQANIKDKFVMPCTEGVYSNIFITEGEYSDSDFEEAINIAPGYTRFVDFKVGEYDYQEALVRVKVEAGPQAQPTAQGVVMHVDIPDTDDRGTAEISLTSGPTPVEFNKFYYTVPEVQVTLRGANTVSGTIIPNIVNITTTHFYVELLTSGGTRVKGSISWVAKGY